MSTTRDPIAPVAAGPAPLTAADRALLLAIARRAVAGATGDRRPMAGSPVAGASARLVEPGRAFVTITVDGELRGCIGTLATDVPLADAVEGAATSAAISDPRFAPLRRTDLPRARIDVSVLGEFCRLPSPDAFRPGIDGILVVRGARRGILLPEVATEMGWTARQMLDGVCAKAGLPREAWRDPATALFAFKSERFGGPALEQSEPNEA